MLIAVIGDTHLPRGRRRIPNACLERLAVADLVIHTGDFVSAGALRELEALGPPVAAVQGNMDSPEVRRELPGERVVKAAGARIGLVHDPGRAAGRLERLRDRFPDADAAVFGHTHLPQHEAAGGFQIFNPGSPTERPRAPGHTMGLARVEGSSPAFELIRLD